MPRHLLRILLTLLAFIVPSAAPLAPAVAQGTPAASPTTASADFAGLFEIGAGRRLWLECRGAGGPTVVLISGFRNNADIWNPVALGPDATATAVLPGVAAFTRVCAYDRPGTVLGDPTDPSQRSRSDPVPMPQTAVEVVTDLHALLEAAAVPGPYVVAGHSFGGLFARLYAATYPVEVVGLVLVDALPEGLEPQLTTEEWEQYQLLNNEVPTAFAAYTEIEKLDFAASFAQMRQAAAASPLRPMPLVVLSHGQPFGVPPDTLGFSPAKLERAWAVGQNELAALTPDAKHIVVADSGHYIQLAEPALVIDTIREVVDAVRDPANWATPSP